MAQRNRSAAQKAAKRKKVLKDNQYDFTILFVVIALVLFGVVMIFSASYYFALTSPQFNDMYSFLKKQLVWATLGFIAMAFMMNFNYRYLKNFAFLAYIATNICLVLVIFIGTEINGSRRWLGIGNLSFQPSEAAKLAVILYLSFYITTHKNVLNTFRGFLRCLLILGIPCALIALQNLSTAIVVGGIGAIILFIASPKIWYFFPFAGLAGAAGAVLVLVPQFAYRLERIKVWLDPFAYPLEGGYQIIQSLYAVASGGLFGLGIGQSRQKTYVPEPYNDIIFAIVCEELGLVGAIILILLFVVLIWRGIKVAMNSEDMFGCLVATGIVGMIAIQVIVNIAVATNTMPNTGMPLPFISYGGTSLVFTMCAMGILLNISRYQKNRE